MFYASVSLVCLLSSSVSYAKCWRSSRITRSKAVAWRFAAFRVARRTLLSNIISVT